MDTILVVEDDPEFRDFLGTLFRLDGRRVEGVGHCREALAILASGVPLDLIVLDLWLPDQDGLDLCRAVKAAASGPPILVVTAAPGVEDEALAAGADLVLHKPVTVPDLRGAVRALLAADRRRAG